MPQSTVSQGFVHLVGAGPGDPDLLTVKALRLIRSADVVVFDRLVSPEILDLIPAGTTRIYAGKALNRHHMPQDSINELLLNLGRSGRRVVRLKGGDPFVFGRGSEEAEHLARHRIPFDVVPGITAAAGCSAYAGIPLTHRGLASGVRFLTGHMRENREIPYDWSRIADADTTLVFYMGLATLPEIVSGLLGAGLPPDTPAAAVRNATTPQQRRVVATLATLRDRVAAAGLSSPATVIIGRVVTLADTLSWFVPAGNGEAEERARTA
ncbi:uroporphyrinogen-III C-methyltransferase [Azospirillum halopraeferens]|uniref:uroporphyrinogen-III C-methyltransferase n=1 Tax=Azospirillum halopraeferens TaxID=34010 RepID=UPI0003F866DF|nr:uroporphyrinogen-III C-methyltransferase [Azospirillum halopraeferens]